MGTGEHNPRNSVSWGDGVYKSSDGGKTWEHMGLKESFQVGRIAIHPTNPDIVYVGALGRLWGPNEQRGLFKTVDGGKTWEKVLYVDDKTGVIDVQMHPENPDTLLVATYERRRDAFDSNDPARKWGPGSGLYKTSDGGKVWRKITKGLPAGKLGRIGIDYYREDPDTVYIVLETESIGKEPKDAAYMGINGEDAEVGARLTEIAKGGPAEKAELKVGDIVVAVDGLTVHSYSDLVREIRQRSAGDTVEIEVSRNRKSVLSKLTLTKRPKRPGRKKGSGRQRLPFGSGLGGQRENVQQQQGPQGHEYGGVYKSTDGGESWTRINSVNPRPMYFSQIRVDPTDDNHVFVLGIPLYRSKDGGETFSADGARHVHVDHHAMWIDPNDGRHIILGNDGGLYVTYDRGEKWDHLNHVAIGQFYHVAVDQRRNYNVYGGLQDNGSWGGPSRARSGKGPVNADWFLLGWGDGFICRVDANDPAQVYFESQFGNMGRYNLHSGERGFMRPRGQRGKRYRFNWKTPFILSHHNSRILLAAGNYVFRSLDRGEKLRSISPEITRTNKGSATALAESPLDSDVLYVGTNDGLLWVTRDGGHKWDKLADFPAEDTALSKAVNVLKAAWRKFIAGGGSAGEKAGARRPARGPAPTFAETQPASAPSTRPATRPHTRPADTQPAGSVAAGPRAGRTVAASPRAGRHADPVSGRWVGYLISEELPPGQGEFSVTLELMPDGRVTGILSSMAGEGEITDGYFEPQTSRLSCIQDTGQMMLDITATVSGSGMTGTVDVGQGFFSFEFEARRTETTAADQPVAGRKQYAWKQLAELLPGPRWVSWIEASRAEAGRVYLTCDGHRSDDDEPYVCVSEDYGQSWRSLRANLPTSAGSTRVVREDIENPDILYLGTEFGAWVSVDRGDSWTRFNSNLPTVAVHEFALHPTAGQIVAATHGRSLWILDVTPLRQMTAEVINAKAHLYEPNSAIHWRPELPRGGGGARHYVGQNPPSGAQICYSLKEKAKRITLKITDLAGETIRELEADPQPGLHRVSWDLRYPPEESPKGSARRGRLVPSGKYLVSLTVDRQTFTQELSVDADPDHPDYRAWECEELGQQAGPEGLAGHGGRDW